MISVMPPQPNPNPSVSGKNWGNTRIVEWLPKSSPLRHRVARQRAPLLEMWQLSLTSLEVRFLPPSPRHGGDFIWDSIPSDRAISQMDRNVTDKNMLPCFWDLSTRGEVWLVLPGVKAQTGERWKVTERGQSCMVVFPHYKLELVLLEHFLLKPSQQSRDGQRWMTKTFSRDQSLPEKLNGQGKPKVQCAGEAKEQVNLFSLHRDLQVRFSARYQRYVEGRTSATPECQEFWMTGTRMLTPNHCHT